MEVVNPTYTHKKNTLSPDFNRLSVAMLAPAAGQKYAEAVALYASACLSLRRVAEMCGMSPCGFDRGDSRIYNKVWSPTVRPLTGYVGRNCPAERESHRRMVGNSMKTGKIAM